MRLSGIRCGSGGPAVGGGIGVVVLRYTLELIAEHHQVTVDLARLQRGTPGGIPLPRQPSDERPRTRVAAACAWLEHYYPAAFCAASLRARPAGAVPELVAAARRSGVPVRRVELSRSGVHPGLERTATYGWPAVRLGLSRVHGLGADEAERIVAERATGGPFTGVAEFARRTGTPVAQLEHLAVAGAFACFGLTGRQALRACRTNAGWAMATGPPGGPCTGR